MIGVFSRPVLVEPAVRLLSTVQLRRLYVWHWISGASGVRCVMGWGLRNTTRRARAYATRHGLPYTALEDGFLRSFGTGRQFPSLSLVSDTRGIYYAADRPSDLEDLLASDRNVLEGIQASCHQAMVQILEARLSKYNLASDLPEHFFSKSEGRRVLVVDQTVGDAGVLYGNANSDTFVRMLEAARAENPGATIYIKTHPEVSAGAKRGYYGGVIADSHTVLLRDPVNPLSLVSHMDQVYVATSHLGFEALLAGKQVTCFGMPWYAGWGATDDRQQCHRRRRRRSVPELFAAAYWHYTSYLDPVSYQRGNIFDAIGWLQYQRKMATARSGRTIAIGFRRWKARNVQPFLGLNSANVHFARSAAVAARLNPNSQDRLVVWGAEADEEVLALARRTGASLVRMEDGFVRSVGLGSDFVAPLSLVLDQRGIYFDPRQASDLECLLNSMPFTAEDLRRAAKVRCDIVTNGITKYNVEPRQSPFWRTEGRKVVLVPGQVEDDASVRYGCTDVRTNLGLLEVVRQQHPAAFIVYKPHPDVVARNRSGRVHLKLAECYADAVETQCSIVSCIEFADEIHTMTSLAGFDALLRGKPVTVYGRPFYAGWGLTRDRLPIARRDRVLGLDELVAGVLLHYPIYWDATLNGFTTCEAVIANLIRQRDSIIAKRGVGAVRMTVFWRVWQKVKLWALAGFLLK